MANKRGQSFADPDTHFQLVRSSSPVDVDGVKIGAPTGAVLCACCWRSAMDVDEIAHEETCPQRYVYSRWWRETHDNAGESANG